jgi:uncharacterized membrane protein YsdA (DUF1294 family)
VAAALLFLALLAVAALAGRLSAWLPAYFWGLSLIAFLVYWADKAAARSGRWRTPEKTLHLLALAGAWPGALMAQVWLRHKTRKRSFRILFWLTVVLNAGILMGMLAWGPARLS